MLFQKKEGLDFINNDFFQPYRRDLFRYNGMIGVAGICFTGVAILKFGVEYIKDLTAQSLKLAIFTATSIKKRYLLLLLLHFSLAFNA